MTASKLHGILFLLTIGFGASASAQNVTVYGQLKDVSGTQNQWFLDCTNVDIVSPPGVNLNPFHDLYVKITGQSIGTPGNPGVMVDTIALSPQVVNVGGDRRPGSRFEIDVFLAPGSQYGLFIGFGTSFVPLGSGGTFMLSAPVLFLGGGTIPASGTALWPVPIPNDNGLIGLELYGQAIAVSGGFAPFLSNVDCKAVRS